MKDEFVKLRVTGEERDAWRRSANVAGISLAAYVRKCVREAQDLEHALEREADAARHRELRREAGERAVSRSASPPRPRPQQREERMGDRRPWGIRVGEALARADRRF